MHHMVRVSRRELVKRHRKALRAAAGLSQMDAAARAGISRDRFWRIENGYSLLTLEERERVARVFGVTDAALEPNEPQAVAS